MPNAVGPSEINSGKHHRFDHVLVQVHACMTTGLLDLVPSNNKSTDGAILSAQHGSWEPALGWGGGGRLKPVSSSLSESPESSKEGSCAMGRPVNVSDQRKSTISQAIIVNYHTYDTINNMLPRLCTTVFLQDILCNRPLPFLPLFSLAIYIVLS